jgi:hypothetical protein
MPDPVETLDLPVITDDTMRQALSHTRTYTLVILTTGPEYASPGARAIVWEHGRRNFALRAAGLLSIVCPVMDDTEVCGIGIFDADAAAVERIMAGDPGVVAGLFSYTIHPVRGFPGSVLPHDRAG